jgi:hypothetical protein
MAATAGSRLAPPAFILDELNHRRQLSIWAQAAHNGHLGNVGNVTLDTGTANTAVVDARVGPNSVIHLMPTTLNAANALSTTFVANRTAEAFTITHANTGTADRAFAYSILG